ECLQTCSGQLAAHGVCIEAKHKAFLQACADEPWGHDCQAGCRAGGETDAEVCVKAAEDARAHACRGGWTGECQGACEGAPASPTCSNKLAQAVRAACGGGTSNSTGQSVADTGRNRDCAILCTRFPGTPGCPSARNGDRPDGNPKDNGEDLNPNSRPAPPGSPKPNPWGEGQNPCANPSGDSCKNYCATPGANRNICPFGYGGD
ncbi:MAG: hypothetical protein HY925_13790, partial [Elusimicrobia bacterium]|nr:hypothetical protein [Elusimicrobiota bacterium]